MAPLYKRYLPPKHTESVALNVATTAPTQTTVRDDDPASRKRLRNEEGISQRKSKKLRREESDLSGDATIKTGQPSVISPDVALEQAKNEDQDVTHHHGSGFQGEFAHIKNAKKRHKLEKEARKIRNNIRKSDKPERSETPPNGSSSGSGTKRKSVEANGNEVAQEPLEGHGTDTDGHHPNKKVNKANTGKVEEMQEIYRDRRITEDLAEGARNVSDSSHGISGAIKSNKRRHKLESVLKQHSIGQDTSLEDQSHLQKHSAVLGKFQKSTKLGRNIDYQIQEKNVQSLEVPSVRDLALPEEQPTIAPDFSADIALPRWLAYPTIVPGNQKVSVAALGLQPEVQSQFTKLGFQEVLPVQRALVPLLLPAGTPGSAHLPGTEPAMPDIAVSAPTGSGKTIAYLLPIIESLKRLPSPGKLRALIVVPTRELVIQVATVAQALVKGADVKIGTATGASNVQDEVSRLVKKRHVYNPTRYRQLIGSARQHSHAGSAIWCGSSLDSDIGKKGSVKETQIFDAVRGLVDHVSIYESAVDILIATPGRLLEHIEKSQGVTMSNLQWLVLDEADKLLDQRYDGLLSVLQEQISIGPDEENEDHRKRHLELKGSWGVRKERRVRKIMLSATMTKDISKLVDINLQRPQLIVVKGDEQGESREANQMANSDGAGPVNESFELPRTLSEHSLHAGDGSEKPLLLIELLQRKILSQNHMQTQPQKSLSTLNSEISKPEDSDSDSELDSRSSSPSSSDRESSDTSSEATSSTDEVKQDRSSQLDIQETTHPERLAMLSQLGFPARSAVNVSPTILIFTSSTESAHRLSYLLKTLRPDLAELTATMTRSSSKSNPHPHAKAMDPTITISTDRAGRGIDAIGARPITHVIQYDVPRSSTSYIHRVGRTARAGRFGEAWTLFTHSEARWFTNEIIRAKNIERSASVEKVKIDVDNEELKEKLVKAVAGMRDKVFGSKK